MRAEVVNCRVLDRSEVWRAFDRAWAKTGKRIAARIAIMAITTRSSMSVKPVRFCMPYSFRSTPQRASCWLDILFTRSITRYDVDIKRLFLHDRAEEIDENEAYGL